MVNACGLVPSLCSLGTTAHLQPIPTVQGRVYAASGAVGVADVDSEIPVSSQWQKKKRKDERRKEKRKKKKKAKGKKKNTVWQCRPAELTLGQGRQKDQ